MDGPKDMTSGEEKELRRVFDRLAQYLPKSKIYGQLNLKRERVSKIKAHKKSPDAINITDTSGKTLSEEQVDALHLRLTEEIAGHEKEIQRFDFDPARNISRDDLCCALSELGKKSTKKEIEDTIWEVDENLDSRLNFTFDKAQHRTVRAALSNTFGFGGHNASVVFRKIEG